jgi:hypothetical protein
MCERFWTLPTEPRFEGNIQQQSVQTWHYTFWTTRSSNPGFMRVSEPSVRRNCRRWVWGAENIVNASIHNKVKRLIELSTDKAANPINLYGASKLASDKLFIAGNHMSGAAGARFSVVPAWWRGRRDYLPLLRSLQASCCRKEFRLAGAGPARGGLMTRVETHFGGSRLAGLRELFEYGRWRFSAIRIAS